MTKYGGMIDAADDAWALGEAFRAGRADPLELAERSLAIAGSEPASFTTLLSERARFEATQARDRWRRGLPLSPLDGVPVSWKDLFDVAGTPTTIASKSRHDAPLAAADAPAVNAGARAGWVAIGKTNLSEFAFSGLGINLHYGTPPGPVAKDGSARIPGGSSSGGASAVSRGAGLIAIGSDTAGSIRGPAAFCGLVGYRPSLARFPMAGTFPLGRSFDTIGPIAHSVRDCIAADRILRGAPVDLPAAGDVRSLRFVVDRTMAEAPGLAPAVRRNFEMALQALEQAGASITYVDHPLVRAAERAVDTFGWLGAVEALAVHRLTLADESRRAQIDPRIIDRLERARSITPDAVSELYRLNDELKLRAADELAGLHLLLPTVPHTAPALEPLLADPALFASTNLATLRHCMVTSFLGLPGVALPNGTDELGLPTSLLVSGAPGADERLLQASLTIESILRQIAA